MVIRIMFFVAFMVLSGALPHLTMYHLDDECLHTSDEDFFGINFTDFYQYCLTTLVWMMTIPMLIFLTFSIFKDNCRMLMYPCMAVDLVFLFTSVILSSFVVVFTIIQGYSPIVQFTHLFNVGTLICVISFTRIYEHYYSKRDLLRTDEADDAAANK